VCVQTALMPQNHQLASKVVLVKATGIALAVAPEAACSTAHLLLQPRQSLLGIRIQPQDDLQPTHREGKTPKHMEAFAGG